MKTYTIKKKRDGQCFEFFGEITANSWQEAKRKFIKMMTINLYQQEDGTYQDECGNEVWGFRDDNATFSEDVYTYTIKKINYVKFY